VMLFTPSLQTTERNPPFDEEMRLWRLALAPCRLQHWIDAQTPLHAL
jgi:hypothetical protein